MCDPNWILAANPHFPETIVSKIRAVFGVETSSRSTHFFGAVERRSKGYPMPLQTTLGLVRDATQRPRRNTTPRRLMGLLRRWRERAHSRPDLCEVDDRILEDIGLRRDALPHKPTAPL
jgi:uncharacterized protein YjiS (DUF1127 family)